MMDDTNSGPAAGDSNTGSSANGSPSGEKLAGSGLPTQAEAVHSTAAELSDGSSARAMDEDAAFELLQSEGAPEVDPADLLADENIAAEKNDAPAGSDESAGVEESAARHDETMSPRVSASEAIVADLAAAAKTDLPVAIPAAAILHIPDPLPAELETDGVEPVAFDPAAFERRQMLSLQTRIAGQTQVEDLGLSGKSIGDGDPIGAPFRSESLPIDETTADIARSEDADEELSGLLANAESALVAGEAERIAEQPGDVDGPLLRAKSQGWTIVLLCIGLSLISACVLIPQADENRALLYERTKLQMDLTQIQKQVAVNEEFLQKMESDPQLAERLVRRQMKVVPQGETVLDYRNDAGAEQGQGERGAKWMSPFQLISVPPPPALPPFKLAGGELIDYCRKEPTQTYVLGGGLFLVAAGLVLGDVKKNTDEKKPQLGQKFAAA